VAGGALLKEAHRLVIEAGVSGQAADEADRDGGACSRVARIDFLEWTADNHLRHTKCVAPREDKPARDVKRE
jgi:hypothetical protein